MATDSSTDFYKIYYCNTKKNETLKAIVSAYANHDRPMVLFISKPDSLMPDKLKEDWKKLCTAKFKKYIAENHMVCLKIEDSLAHYKKLKSDSRKYLNSDGSKHQGEIVLIKPSILLLPHDYKLNFVFKNHCITFISGYKDKEVNTDKVIEWLEASKSLESYKKSFPNFLSNPSEPDFVLAPMEEEPQEDAKIEPETNEDRCCEHWEVSIRVDTKEQAEALKEIYESLKNFAAATAVSQNVEIDVKPVV